MPKPSSLLCVEVELGGAVSPICEFTEDRGHLRPEIGAHGVLGLVGGIIGIAGIVDRLQPLDRSIAGGDIAILERRF
jgi:hypothetical protein